MNRPNPRVAAAHILAARDHDDAIERTRRQLARAWVAGNRVGFLEGVSDATDDDPIGHTPNPYGDPR